MPAHGHQDEPVDRHDLAVTLHGRQEHARRVQPVLAVAQANKHLVLQARRTLERHDPLCVQHQPVLGDGQLRVRHPFQFVAATRQTGVRVAVATDAVASLLLGHVARRIGRPQQPVGIDRLVVDLDNADAAIQAECASVPSEGLPGQCRVHARQRGFRFVQRGVVQQHGELVAPQPAQPVSTAQLRRQAGGEMAQEAVAGLVPAGVVDQLELVQVDEAQRVPLPAAVRGFQRAVQPARDLAPVDQAGEFVMAGLVGDLAGQFVRFGHVLGQSEQLLAAPTAHADPRSAPAHPAHRAIAAQQAALPRLLQPHPVDGAALVHGQVIDVEHIGQTLHAQLRQRHAQDPAQRLIRLGEPSLAIHLEHADHRLVEGQTELAFGVAHSPQGAAHHVQGVSTQQDEGGRTERQQHASQEVRALGQRTREGQLLRSQARIDGGDLPLVGEHAGLIGHAPRPMGFQRIGQHDQLVDLGLRLPPQAHRFAEVRRIVQQAVHPDQAFDILRCIAALQESRTRRREVDRVALQGLASRRDRPADTRSASRASARSAGSP